jgi:aminoglycoside 6'-N-acetyltransferase
MTPVLLGTATTLRPIRSDDAERLGDILAQPEVARWWGAYDAQRVQADLFETPEAVVFAIEVNDDEPTVIGSIQYVEERSPDYRHASIDVFLDPAWHGKGLGTDAVRTLARHLIVDHGHHRLVIDPAADNAAAIRCYGKVGFRPVGIMRRYERSADGTWHDGLLMDLLAEELTEEPVA